ncbi:MAG TPA: LexA family transcriptional regulator [Candidatus Cybelea sp.]|nr:LexA family transcriptional regulator [Candidatus Cybelea sp.]
MENRLRELRKRAGLTLENVSEKVGLSISQISRLEREASDLTGERLQQFAALYECTPADLISEGRTSVPLVGYVGGGAEVYPFDDAPLGGGFEQVDAPPNETRTVIAVEVRGDSMFPAYREGDLIYYAREHDFSPDACVGAECVVKIADGPTLVKTVMRGADPMRWTLLSYNAPPIEGARIEWAAPVLWVDKRRRRR